MSETADPRDDAQKFAERIVSKYWGDYEIDLQEVTNLIAAELRAGGWVKGRAGPHVASEDLMSGIQ